MPSHLISIAPMMDYTDRHCRYFLRLISRRALLYTEMITTEAILRGNSARLLAYHPAEHPLALQLGGSDPKQLAACAQIAFEYGYDEVNLNVGCPSDRVQSGSFGACLMKQPHLVADCVAAMKSAVPIPITVKTRIGVDDLDSYEYFAKFIETVTASGCETFIIHARKAWLKGLSPKENREIPPLRYDLVYRLKQDFRELKIIINGGIKNLQEAQTHLQFVDGVMLGRQAYREPYLLSEVDRLFYQQQQPPPSALEIVRQMLPYIEQQLVEGVRLQQMIKPMIGLFHGTTGARIWRRFLSENAHRVKAGVEIVEQALQSM